MSDTYISYYLMPVAVLVKTITDIAFPINPNVATMVKITPSVTNLNISSSICASTSKNK